MLHAQKAKPATDKAANLIFKRRIGLLGAPRFDGKLALNCFVIEGGEIAVGDEMELVRGRACAEAAPFTE